MESRLSLTMAVAVFLLLVNNSCKVPSAEIHADFSRLQPKLVRVAPVENGTLITNLSNYKTSGLIQSLMNDRGEINVLEEFRAEARQELNNRGYILASSRGGSSSNSGVDGELRIRLERWEELPASSSGDIGVSFDVELLRLDLEESLYHARCDYRLGGRYTQSGTITPAVIRRDIASAVRSALSALPKQW